MKNWLLSYCGQINFASLQTLKLVKSCARQHDFYNFLDAVMTICFYWIEITDVPNDKTKKLVYYHVNEKLIYIYIYILAVNNVSNFHLKDNDKD